MISEKMNNLTIQINISAGDVLYARQTVSKLIEQHSNVENRLLIVDCTKPQKTKVINPAILFREPEFSERVKEICTIAEEFMTKKLFTDICFLRPKDQLFEMLAKKYYRKGFTETHDSRAVTIMGYLAGIELTKTRYMLHYDADMLLHQKEDYDWAKNAIELMEKTPEAVISAPRNSPPSKETRNVPTFHNKRPIRDFGEYWLNDWFGSRCFLIDKQKLQPYLPLMTGKYYIEALLRKLSNKTYPMAYETLIFKKLGENGKRKLILKTENAWTMHPVHKKLDFVELLPKIFVSLKNDRFPEKQGGWEDMDFELWTKFLS